MNSGRTIFSQVMDFLPLQEFRRCVQRYRGEYKMQSFSCLGSVSLLGLRATDLARKSPRHRSVFAFATIQALSHGFPGSRFPATRWRYANEQRDWRIFADFARVLIGTARQLYRDEPFGVELDQDRICPGFHHHRFVFGAVSLGAVPPSQKCRQTAHVARSARQHSDQCLCDQRRGSRRAISWTNCCLEAGAFYLLDRGYLDFARLYMLQTSLRFLHHSRQKVTQF